MNQNPPTPKEAQQTLDQIVGFVATLKAEIALQDAWVLQNHFQKLAQFIQSTNSIHEASN